MDYKIIKPVTIVYKYGLPFRHKICNYSKLLREISNEELIKIINSECLCSQSQYIYAACNHIITGDLSIIGDQRLESFFAKGAKFRPPVQIVWKDVFQEVQCSIFKYIQYLVVKYKMNITEFDDFSKWFLEIVKSRILACENKQNVRVSQAKVTFDMLRKLKDLHKLYVITPADKAGNNFIFMCKKLYLTIMCEEFGITISENNEISVAGNAIYEPASNSLANIVQQHDYLKKYYGLGRLGLKDSKVPVIC